jgi:predicted ATPase
MIRRLEVRNFKRFKPTTTFEFRSDGLTLIAGGNNSGKSSILHALTNWEYCRRAIETRHGRAALEAGGGGHVVRTAFKDFTPLTVPNFQHLWTNLSTAAGGTPAPMILKVVWLDLAAAGAERELEFTLDLPGLLRVKVSSSSVPLGARIPRAAYLPPFAGIQVKESKLSVAERERLVGQGLPGAVLRNHLCDLERRSRENRDALRDLRGRISSAVRSQFLRTDAWLQLVAVLNEEFKCMVYPAESRPRSDGRIDLTANLTSGTFIDGRFKKYTNYQPRDLIVEGSGFLQWLSVFALAADPENDVLLLDEADVHLHPSLQTRMLFRLNREAIDKKKQMLYVTHSTEILRAADYRTIYHITKNDRGYLGEESGKVSVIEGLGSLYLPRIEKLKREKRLLIIEGTSDLELLKIWAAKLGIGWPDKLVEWYSTGKPSERKILFAELAKEVAGLQVLSLRDRDDEAPKTTSADLTDGSMRDPAVRPAQTSTIVYRKWRRRQIENYLVLPAAIARAALAKGRQCTEQEVVEFLAATHSAVINDTFVQTDCNPAIADLRAKEITYEDRNNIEARFGPNRFDIARAMNPEEICDDVKTLLEQIRNFCR